MLGFKEITSSLYAAMYTFDGWDLLCVGIEDIENPNRSANHLSTLIGTAFRGALSILARIQTFRAVL